MTLTAGALFEADEPSTATVAVTPFRLSIEDSSDPSVIVESAFASGGRYVGEMARRLAATAAGSGPIIVFNPSVRLASVFTRAILELVPRMRVVSLVVVDALGRPVAYAFGPGVLDEVPPAHLGLLTGESGALDAELLRLSFGECRSIPLPALGPLARRSTRFYWIGRDGWRATSHAVELLTSLPSAARAAFIRTAPRAGVLPWHAGDILFLAQAIQLERAPFDALVVSAAYADIVARVGLAPIAVERKSRQPNGATLGDEWRELGAFVDEARTSRPEPRLYHPLRPLFRVFRPSRHHLREALAFAVGGRGEALRAPLPIEARPAAAPATKPKRVVVHFEGGWSLKEYPRAWRGELLALLRANGWQPVVLGKPVDGPSVPYSTLGAFEELIGDAAGFIGGDSFPGHFANAVGLPVVHLFGPTRPENARGIESPRYRFLHRPLPCVPCGELFTCKVDGAASCIAHATPGQVVDAFERLVLGGAASS